MRLNLHDFSGHPFQAQLSRNLAARGHYVLHGFSAQYVTGHGRLSVDVRDPCSLRFDGISAARPMIKYSPVGRARFESAYASAWSAQLEAEQFDVVVACNVPLLAMAKMRRYFIARRQPWVFWHQDIYSAGMAAEASRRLPGIAARTAGRAFARAERALVRDADAIVAIGPAFVEQYARWGVRNDHVSVIPNWAPLDELVPGERDNEWAAGHNLPREPIRLMYAGTLGRKHNPLLLLDLLDGCLANGVDAILIVVSEGVGVDDLAVAAEGRADVRIIDYQPVEDLSMMLASADVTVALLEPDAAHFSVPSKVHSYLAAGRPTIALMPGGNPAAKDIGEAGGFVAAPSEAGAREAAAWLADADLDVDLLRKLGRQARDFAVQHFDIDRIGAQFEDLLWDAKNLPKETPRTTLLGVSGEANGGRG